MSDTNTMRFFRIVRSGDINFTFFWKTNSSDSWVQITNNLPPGGVLTRADFAGVPLQVGIAQMMFSTAAPEVYFTDFELSGTNVTFPTLPTAPSGLTISPVNSNSVSLSWTPGAGSDGSLVLIRGNGPIIAQPAHGQTYTADTNFQASASLLCAGSNHVVYVGSGSTVTVTGLGGSNNTYNAAVFSYSGAGSSRVYNTANPALATASGPGRVGAVSFTVAPASIPAGGAARATLKATYTSGDSYDVSSDSSTLWSSSDTSIITAGGGVLSGIAVGSATISATYAGVTGTSVVSVHNPAHRDNFGTSHDYVVNGIAGSTWDGVYLKDGDFPNFDNGGTAGATTLLNANISSNNVLTLRSHGNGWEGTQDNGPFLFKIAPGDFEVSVHITAYDHPAYHFVGLMARLAGAGGGPGGPANPPTRPNGTESHINLWRFDLYGVTTSTRATIADAVNTIDQTDSESQDYWLLMTRSSGTNFNFYKKANASDPWTLIPVSFQQPELDGLPLQVGLAQALYTANAGNVWFDSFMFDAAITGVAPPSAASGLTMTLNPDNVSMNLTWTAGTNSDGSPATSMVIMRADAPVSEQPYFGFLSTADSRFGFGTDLGSGNYVVYRAVGTNVTVTGLVPGHVYYAAVYSYAGSGATKVFNQQTTAIGSLPAGTLIGISSSLPGNGIPRGGIGLPAVHALYTGGGSGEISSLVDLASSDPNVVAVTNGVLTGLANGTSTITVSFQGFTNTLIATVRAPGFTDNFAVNHDYLVNRATNTVWDGVYLNAGDIPGGIAGSGQTTTCDANVTSNGVLTVVNVNGAWEAFAPTDAEDGFFLFKYVPADFQAAVHLTAFDVVNYNSPGLLARAYGTNGAPFAGTNGECWVSWTRFDEFGIGTYARQTIDNVTTRSPQPVQGDTNYWLLIVRRDGTNFSFYQRVNATDPWQPSPNGTTYSVPSFAGVPMQVGICQATFNNIPAMAQFDSFMLDTVLPTLSVSRSGADVVLSWPAVPGVALQYTTSLKPVNWLPVGTTPVTSGGISSVTLPPSAATEFFRLVH